MRTDLQAYPGLKYTNSDNEVGSKLIGLSCCVFVEVDTRNQAPQKGSGTFPKKVMPERESNRRTRRTPPESKYTSNHSLQPLKQPPAILKRKKQWWGTQVALFPMFGRSYCPSDRGVFAWY